MIHVYCSKPLHFGVICFVVLGNKYSFLWILSFVCLSWFFVCFSLVETQKCFKVLKHIGMILDENNIRKRTARLSSEWLKNSGGLKAGEMIFKTAKVAYFLKVMGSLK